MAAGPFRLVTIAYAEAHPVTGRPIPALEPDARQALRIAASLDA